MYFIKKIKVNYRLQLINSLFSVELMYLMLSSLSFFEKKKPDFDNLII